LTAAIRRRHGKEHGMVPSPQLEFSDLPSHGHAAASAHRREDLMYQVMTVAAMVSLVVSLWLF
jgi:hypothetical protein